MGRKSYHSDIVFIISYIEEDVAILQGLYVRLVADSPLSDLELIDHSELSRMEQKAAEYEKSIVEAYQNKMGHITGKILHLDSDPFI